MSKFIDILRQCTQAKPARMGFGVSSASVKPRIQTVAEISNSDITSISKCIIGSDAAILSLERVSSALEIIQKLSTDFSTIFWGVRIAEQDNVIDDLRKSSPDFIIFPSTMPFFTTQKDLGVIMEIDFNISDSSLGAIEELPVDALFINDSLGSINWQFLMNIQRIDNILSKPLLMHIDSNIDIAEIEILWKVGIDAIVKKVEGTSNMNNLKQTINNSNFPFPRKFKKVEVTLPFISSTSTKADEEEQEEEN